MSYGRSIRVLMAILLATGLAFALPAHHLLADTHHDSQDHNSSQSDSPKHGAHDSSHCAVCILAKALTVPPLTDLRVTLLPQHEFLLPAPPPITCAAPLWPACFGRAPPSLG